jgi:uncharacterized membrane protein required for colicin V production
MHWLDCTILALLAATAVLGAWSGFVMQVFRLVGFVGAAYVAACLNDWGATWLASGLMHGAEQKICCTVAFGVTFLLIFLAIFLLTLLLERGVEATQLQLLNRGMGAALAVGKTALVLGAVIYGLQKLPVEQAKPVLEQSALATLLGQAVDRTVQTIPDEWKNDWLASWQQVKETLPKGRLPLSTR